jgi:homoserine dehydrogenase
MLGFNHHLEEGLTLKNPDTIVSKYYLRLRITDKPGILAQITQLFAQHTISVEAMIQRPSVKECTQLLFATHETLEYSIRNLMSELETLDAVLETPYMIRIV